MAKTRIFIVDDHPIVRSSLDKLISVQPDMLFCGESGDLEEASRLIAEKKPDIVLVDILLDQGNGLDLIRQLQASKDLDALCLVFSALHDPILIQKARMVGAVGFVNKQSPISAIVDAIRTVRSGRSYFPAPPSAGVLDAEKAAMADGVARLTQRELQVYRLIGDGLGTGEIARRLNLSVKTIESHKENIKNKLGLRSANELLRHAIRWAMTP